MANPDVVLLKPNEIDRPGKILTWIVTVLACAYIGWVGASLYYSTPIFINMYTSMGVDLHLPIKILIGFYRVMYPILFGGMAALVITKQLFVRDKWFSVSLTLAAALAVSLIGYGIVRTLYQPLFDVMEKLNK
ncbi:hypothetical protein AYO50_01325 [Acidobacteria bacterium SCGC AG-212-P17]|nr:hypothetical protein AYO50_01325 [Acidobacteria bacterium SCGC AG-212-P17]